MTITNQILPDKSEHKMRHTPKKLESFTMKTLRTIILIGIVVALLMYLFCSFSNADLKRVKQLERKHFKVFTLLRHF